MGRAKDGTNRGSKPGERRGGRQKGTENRNTLALREMLEAYGMGTTKDHPVLRMYKIGCGDIKQKVLNQKTGKIVEMEAPLELQGRMLDAVASFIEARRKAIEFKDGDGNTVAPVVMSFETLPTVDAGLLRVMQMYRKNQAKKKGNG